MLFSLVWCQRANRLWRSTSGICTAILYSASAQFSSSLGTSRSPIKQTTDTTAPLGVGFDYGACATAAGESRTHLGSAGSSHPRMSTCRARGSRALDPQADVPTWQRSSRGRDRLRAGRDSAASFLAPRAFAAPLRKPQRKKAYAQASGFRCRHANSVESQPRTARSFRDSFDRSISLTSLPSPYPVDHSWLQRSVGRRRVLAQCEPR